MKAQINFEKKMFDAISPKPGPTQINFTSPHTCRKTGGGDSCPSHLEVRLPRKEAPNLKKEELKSVRPLIPSNVILKLPAEMQKCVKEIGGNKILLEDKDARIFLDFGIL